MYCVMEKLKVILNIETKCFFHAKLLNSTPIKIYSRIIYLLWPYDHKTTNQNTLSKSQYIDSLDCMIFYNEYKNGYSKVIL